jgi:hypothetical protein
MILIDNLAGITEISNSFYEVISVVNIGSNSDDVEGSTFTIKDGGLEPQKAPQIILGLP